MLTKCLTDVLCVYMNVTRPRMVWSWGAFILKAACFEPNSPDCGQPRKLLSHVLKSSDLSSCSGLCSSF